MNIFARAFVVANRMFGAFTAAGGALLLATTITSFDRGFLNLGSLVLWAAVSAGLIVIGIVYLRAPLFRTQKPTPDDSAAPKH
jgi:hypothetical protein